MLVGTLMATRTIAVFIENMWLQLEITVEIIGPMDKLAAAVAWKLRDRTSVAVSRLCFLGSGTAGMIAMILLLQDPVVVTSIASLMAMGATAVVGRLMVLGLMWMVLLRL